MDGGNERGQGGIVWNSTFSSANTNYIWQETNGRREMTLYTVMWANVVGDPRVPWETTVPDDGRPLRGRVLPGTSADTLLFSVALGQGEPGNPSLGLRGMVPIPMSDVELVEVRRLEKGRTWAFVGVGALLGLVVLDWAFDITNADEPGSEPGGADNAVIVRFRLRR